MAHVYPARTADISLSTGLGQLSVNGVPVASNMRTFSQVMEIGDTIYLGIAHRDAAQWEEGIYTYIGTNRFARTVILESSNGNGPVDFSAGIKDVWATIPSRTVQRADENVTNDNRTTIDFGAWPGSPDTSLVVTGQTAITDTSFVMAQVVPADTDDHTADEHWVDPPILSVGEIVPNVGFTVRALARDGNLYGKYSIAWLWK